MKFGNKKEKNNVNEEKKEEEIEIILGDDSELNISDVGDYMNDLRPKGVEKQKKVVIPKSKK